MTSETTVSAGAQRWFDLLKTVGGDEHGSHGFARLTIEQVEVLEAELLNQGRLPQYPETALLLTRHLSCDAALWRWKQRRFGLPLDSVRVHVALPEYVLTLRHIYCSGTSNSWQILREDGSDSGKCHQVKIVSAPQHALEYLEAVACFLVTSSGASPPRMQLASDLLIKYIVGKPPEDSANVLIPTPSEA